MCLILFSFYVVIIIINLLDDLIVNVDDEVAKRHDDRTAALNIIYPTNFNFQTCGIKYKWQNCLINPPLNCHKKSNYHILPIMGCG
jgi:hypothetical protein